MSNENRQSIRRNLAELWAKHIMNNFSGEVFVDQKAAMGELYGLWQILKTLTDNYEDLPYETKQALEYYHRGGYEFKEVYEQSKP